MEQKDFILREIEKISVLLQYLIGKFIPAKTIQEQQTTEELINKELKEKYGNDLEYILNLKEKDFETEFTRNKGFSFENIELLADLLFTLGNDPFNIKTNYLQRALGLYEYIDKKSKTYSFERQKKIDKIRTLL
ncbi:MAG: hypothetical protein KAQ75_10385 [Bacteroidales bacterium]|nr:hypothetical protein [Bacteroidales bacterium]